MRGLLFAPMPFIAFISLKNISLPEFESVGFSEPAKKQCKAEKLNEETSVVWKVSGYRGKWHKVRMIPGETVEQTLKAARSRGTTCGLVKKGTLLGRIETLQNSSVDFGLACAKCFG